MKVQGLLGLLATLVAVLALPASAAEGPWVAQPDVPGARQEVSYVQLAGKFYLAGGGTAHQKFDPQTGQWSNVAPLPVGIDHVQGVAVGGKIYYIGGLSNWPSPHVSTVYIYDPAANTFSQGQSMGARGRGAGGVAVNDGKIYYAGGLNNGVAVKWFDVYDPQTNDWDQLPDMPTARDHFHAAVLDGKLWAIGGRNVQIGSTTPANEAFSFASGTWSTGHAPLPTARGGFAVGTHGDEIFVIGGEDATKAHGTVEAFNVETNTWRTVATPMPVPRHGIQAAKCNGGFYVAGGGTAPGHNPSTAHHAYFPGGSARPCGGVVAFGKSPLAGESSDAPTSLQFGPDGRLYVAQQSGLIKAYTVSRAAANDYDVTATETIDLIKTMPNRDDDGTLADASVNQFGRLVTGIVVTGTPASPVIYVGSSDPRIGAGEDGTDLDLDTNSGIISKLTKSGSSWTKQDLVRGLPRSEENHTVNGLALSADGNTLYAAQGGNTNKGAPSNNFAGLSEYALSAAILSIDLQAIGNTTYDLPTLNDPDRPGSPDANDPFGGNDGKNQARLVTSGPVKVFAPGFRNPYDIVLTESGRMFSIDNGGNAGWGDKPLPDSAAGTCTNTVQEPGTSDRDGLHRITGLGYYGGHPNPTRANKSNTFGGQTPIDGAANPIECDYRAPGDANGNGNESGALATFGSSTNGLAEYTATNFGGSMQGDLVSAGLDLNNIYRIQLTSNTKATVSTLVSNAGGGGPLDVIAQGDDDPFPGTIWFVDIYNGGIYVLEPSDYGGGSAECDLNVPDADGDGFSNGDELANGTNPCSAADTPPDADGDKVSDRTDPNDDNDALADTADPFARDPSNGLSTALPVNLEWENNSAPGGLLNLGFTGLMQTPGVDYLDQFDRTRMTTGGAAGVVTVDEVPAGDAYTNINSQQYGFQLGFSARPAVGPFTVHTRIVAPFAGLVPKDYQSMGLFVGTGDQDNYVKVTTAHIGQTVVESLSEFNGLRDAGSTEPLTLPGPSAVDLYLRVDPVAGNVQPSFTSTTGGVTSPRRNVGTPLTVPASWFSDPDQGLAAGIISTSNGGGGPFPASWDFLKITAAPAAPTLSDSDPDSPANDNSPLIKGSAQAGSTIRVYTTANCGGSAAATGSAAAFASPGLSVSVADNSTTTFRGTATDAAGNTSGCSVSSLTYVEDSTAPAGPTLTDSDPDSPANVDTPKIKGSAEAGSTVRLYTSPTCTGSPAATASAVVFGSPGISVGVLADSTTTFRGTATDAAGNTSACSSSSLTYVEDSAAPAAPTLSDSDPDSPANDNSPLIKGSAEAGSTVRLYTTANCGGSAAATGSAAAFASPGLSVSVADNSTTTFRGTATDAAGNTSGCSANSFVYVEDSPPPPPPAPPPPPPPPPAPPPPPPTPAPPPPPPSSPRAIAYKVPPQRLGTALRRGYVIRLECPSACTASGRLDASRNVARRYRLARRATGVARGSASRPNAGPKVLVLRFTSKAKRSLLRARRVELTLRLTLVQRGERRSVRRTVRLSR